jgi:hypothetical protein
MVTFSNYGVISIYHTSDAGGSWTAVAGNLEEAQNGSGAGPSVRWASVCSDGATRVWFVGTSVGLYSTTVLSGSGTVWAQEGGGTIGRVVVDMMDVRQLDKQVVVATHGFGVFGGTINGGEPPPGAPAAHELQQNFPNPFNGGTTIRFRTSAPGRVALDVCDLSGRQVALLLDQDRQAGLQPDVVWAPENLAGGVYLYRLRAPGFTAARKLLYLK